MVGSKSVDDSAAKTVAGYQQALVLDDPSDTVPGWALVFTDSCMRRCVRSVVKIDWQAWSDFVFPKWFVTARLSCSLAILAHWWSTTSTWITCSKRLIQCEASYVTNTVLHFQLEPVNAIGLQRDGRWELHTGNHGIVDFTYLSQALGVAPEKVVMRTYMLAVVSVADQ